MDHIYARLAEARKKLGKTQTQIAQEAGVSLRTYTRYESGDGSRDIPSCIFKVIAQNGINTNWIITGQGPIVLQHDIYGLPPEELPKLGQRLACVRKEKGYSEEEMAQYMDVDVPTYKEFEAGTKEPERRSLSFIITGQRISFDWMLYGTGEMDADSVRLKENQGKASNIIAGDAEMIDHILLLNELPPHRRKEVYAYTRDRKLLMRLEEEERKEYDGLL